MNFPYANTPCKRLSDEHNFVGPGLSKQDRPTYNQGGIALNFSTGVPSIGLERKFGALLDILSAPYIK